MKFLSLVLVALCAAFSDARLREGDCGVCIEVVKKFQADAKASKAKSQKKIEQQIVDTCKGFHPEINSQEKRMCYYIGAADDSASTMLRELSGPMKNGFPPEKICEKLKAKDMAICELRFKKKIDLGSFNLKKARVKELKNILSGWGEKCQGCTAKSDYINRIKQLMPEKDPEAAKAQGLSDKEEL